VRDSLPEPDPFRLKYRAALIEVVSEIVRRKLASTTQQIAALAAPLVPHEDRQRFSALVAEELNNLHDGNVARFRLRPAELDAWRAAQAG